MRTTIEIPDDQIETLHRLSAQLQGQPGQHGPRRAGHHPVSVQATPGHGVKRAIERLMRKADWCDAGQGPNIAQSIANGSAQPVSRLIKPSK
ncbi:hypothetical protein [Thiohalocapsa sp. ML1]|jgi:hypothetical protein|uniref:hypothetical protein n=1 Tax=Thiohalocapsa sp. ML1 TaxID=1431688 RepID=UPI0012E3EDC4|nr:hypothetical protein [Thiohalocapsa sp. ML1]